MSKDFLVPFFIQNRPFTLDEFARKHRLTLHNASVILTRFVKSKDLVHIRRGIYYPVSNKGITPEEAFSDPWVIVPYLFPNAIIGGWSAANYWGLTEQIFRSTLILQKNHVFKINKSVGRFQFVIYKSHMPIDLGIETAWIGNISVPVSDKHRTIVDMIENPKCGGGIQHTIDCFKTYLNEGFDEKIILNYISHVRNGVFFKRFGYISEQLLGEKNALSEYSKTKISQGFSPIDSSLKCSKLITRWNLYINSGIDL